MKKGNKSKFTFIDLFAGCGGLTEGFLRSGKYEALAHVEWELPMVHTLRHRLEKAWGYSSQKAEKDVVHFDIQRTEELVNGNWSSESIDKYGKTNHPDILKSGLKGLVKKRKVDVIIGGPPCQAYSIHGRAQDKNSMQDDYRNYLFESFVRVVSAFQPSVFIFENVTGILSAKPGGRYVTERIYEAFTDAGYEIYEPKNLVSAVFDAVDFGVPQYRRRVIIVGMKKGTKRKLSDFYSSINREKSDAPMRTVRDAIGLFPKIYPIEKPIKVGRANVSHKVENPDANITQHLPRYHAPREVGIFKDWIERDLNHVSHAEQVAYYTRVTGRKTLYTKYKNLTWDKPSHTVVAHLSKDGMMFIHPDSDQSRSITIREAATLMSFPLDYDFIGSNPYCFRMIGNAVPVLLAKGIANGIAKELKRTR